MSELDGYLREHHPLLALRLDIEAYQRSLPMDAVLQIGNRFLPTRGGFGGRGVAYGKHLVLTEVHTNPPGKLLPYAIIRRENEDRGSVLVFKTWWRDLIWLQDPSTDTGWGRRIIAPLFRDFLESVFDESRYFPTHHSEV